MFYPSEINSNTSRLRLRVNAQSECRGWGLRLRQAGWRSFVCATKQPGFINCILKKDQFSVLLSQSESTPTLQVVEVPSDRAHELCQLLVASGLAAPA